MRKKIIIVLVIVIVLAIIGVSFALWWNKSGSGTGSSSTTTTTTNFPPVSTSTTPAAIPTSTTVTIGTSQGSVTMNNFYQTADSITQDQQTVIIHNDPQYSIEYNVGDSSFSIGILSTPLEASRQAAEAVFLSRLGISKQDACKLKVYEGVPADVSSQYVGQYFPLSFCGNATPLQG